MTITPLPQRPFPAWGLPVTLCLSSVTVLLLFQALAGSMLSFWPFLLIAPVALALLFGPAWGCATALIGGIGQALLAWLAQGPVIDLTALSLSPLTFIATGCLAAVGASALRQIHTAQREEAKVSAAQLRLASVTGDPSSLPALLAAAVWAVPELTGRPVCGLFLWDPARGVLTLAQQSPPRSGHRALPPALTLEPARLPSLARAMETGDPAVVARTELEACAEATALDCSTAAWVPLINWGRVLGCLLLADPPLSRETDKAPVPFTDRELDLARGIAGQVAVALENAQFYDTILRQKEQLAEQNARLAEQKERLEALEKLREDLTHMIVHDMRTPLTGMMGSLQMLTGGHAGVLPAQGHELASLAMSSTQTLLGMVNDLLDVGKIEAGQMALEKAPVPIAAMARSALDQVRAIADQRAIRLIEDLPYDLPAVCADEDMVRRILVNLLGNALKFTPGKGEVALEARSRVDAVLVRVRDTGEGIPEEEQERIFEKFGQVESRKGGRKMSTGLGLTFCKLAVEAHGGTIGVESAPGQGSTFWFTLPVDGAAPGSVCPL
jgi:signal transduction histidine kinase